MLKELASELEVIFSTNQNYHAAQQDDGTYRKAPGLVNKAFLERNLKNGGSVAVYQKNNDNSIKWVCFDFDILKSNLEDSKIKEATIELNKAAKSFCLELDSIDIPYLIEVSGNRGFHVWITFSENISYQIGYDILQAIVDKCGLSFNDQKIDVDLFPSSRTPTDGVGLGVKIPISKHKKTGYYSQLLESTAEIESWSHCDVLDTSFVERNLSILRKHKGITRSDLEKKLGVILDISQEDIISNPRVRLIKIHNAGFNLGDLEKHWELHLPLKMLSGKIFKEKKLNHEERKLLVGMFANIYCKDDPEFGNKLLHEIFGQTSNYNYGITQKTIRALSSFYFPTQDKIEMVTGESFEGTLNISDLIKNCIPKYHEHKDATFDISRLDIEVTRLAEQNYLLVNDEAQSKIVLNALAMSDGDELLTYTLDLLKSPTNAKFYRHVRNEGKKTRTLYTLEAPERILTSCFLKQLVYFLNVESSHNSLGYRVNKGFAGGYIFQPWLYLWINFISNISSAIDDKDNKDFYIIKTDISQFYDKIPHDNLKRMLLGGVNPKIDKRREQLSGDLEDQYKTLIDVLFVINEKIIGGNVGLPQGPAYARYLAELYLDNIDAKLDKKLSDSEILLYQRYVDDIFIIAPSLDAANDVLKQLKDDLESLGLCVNNEKTIIAKIKNFSQDFNQYRSQSKYAVDKVSRNFEDATEAQQNIAITEFMKLVQSDSCDDDLSFIFSHLNGVPYLDKYKKEKVTPAVSSGVGRGSVYKYIFTFVLENSANFYLLRSINKFTELQSEVLTAVLITLLENNKYQAAELNAFFEELEPSLSLTDMVAEHLCYMAIKFNTRINLSKIKPELIIKTIATVSCNDDMWISASLLSHINTELNNIKDLPYFVRSIYPLCTSSNIDKNNLNNLASTFYAKMSVDEENGLLSITTEPKINTTSTALKFYYLLCLFSPSNKNTSRELLKEMWKYCAFVHNYHNVEPMQYSSHNWLSKINDIDIDHAKCQFIISSIVDGNIFRGLCDKNKVFERFHTLLLIFLTFKEGGLQTYEVEDALKLLKDKAVFYRWLIDRESVQLFPSARAWFEKNVVENNMIMLKRQDKVLIRRPTSDFHEQSLPVNEHNGYSEVILNHNSAKLKSLIESLEGLNVKQKFGVLIGIIGQGAEFGKLPNFFCNEKLLFDTKLKPFSNELYGCANLIYEDSSGGADSYVNNKDNFIRCFLRAASNVRGGNQINDIIEKYVNNLPNDIDLFAFINSMYGQLIEVGEHENVFFSILLPVPHCIHH